jgi:hypothetical protein
VSPRKISARENNVNIDRAARVTERPAKASIDLGTMTPMLHIARSRPAPEPQPVDTSLLSWRVPQPDEEGEIEAARLQERAREAAQLAGLT